MKSVSVVAVAVALMNAGMFSAHAAAASVALDEDMASANESDEAPITVTATRSPLELDDAPAVVTVIDEERIANEMVTDIKDLVRFEPGISVRRAPARFGAALGTTGRAGNEGITVRGIGGNRVLIQVDGVRVPDGFVFGAQSVGRGDYVDVGLVKSVEILRGPASSLYGSDGLAGVISFTTSDPEDLLRDGHNIGGLARAGYSSADNEFAETLILAARAGDVSLMAAYTRRDFNELKNKGTNNVRGPARTTPNPQDGASNAILGRFVWKPAGGHKLRVTGEYLDNRVVSNVLSGLARSRFTGATTDRLVARDTGSRKRVSADWSWNGEDTLEFARLAVYWQESKDRQFSAEDRTPSADRTRINTFDNRVIGASGEVRAGFETGSVRHRLVVGGDLGVTRQQGIRDGTVPPFGETFPTRAFPITDYTLVGAFIADEISFAGGTVTLFPSVRLDHYKLSPKMAPLLPRFTPTGQSRTRVSPKIGAVIKLSDHVRLFGNYGRGFKAPEPSQINQFFENLAFGYTSRPNPNLGPETSATVEGGVRVSTDFLSGEVTAFHGSYDNFISRTRIGGSFRPRDPAIFQFRNLNRVEVSGVEGRMTVNITPTLTGRLAFAYADGTQRNARGVSSPLETISPLKLVGGLGYRDVDGRFGGQLIATWSAQKSASDTAAGNVRPGDYLVFDLTAFVKVTDGLTLRGGFFNITDRKYAEWSDIRGLTNAAIADAFTRPGRNVSVSASIRF